ncbi:hypothetical protein FZC33_00105 [Labrys sp. KNU-23]|uniref:hypothetical protein n=1 Tax=Labrys sp. KNU-23 TaxID=2789216 RepID=UPI0011EE2C7A|nr:hypothetical protein [Labrys sp. KNU-23]QEN84735.1 hypothetical protein FZC33_00105 [Labrys sp. KNU-23]
MPDEIRLSLIDDSNRDDHSRLTPDDICYYLFEYTSHRGYSFSKTNGLISNLKKKPSTAGQAGYQYKDRAIATCARHLAATLNLRWLQNATLVPIPGSKMRGHPDFDDRIERLCRAIRQPPPDVRALVMQTASTTASHEVGDGDRVTVDELLEVYAINEALTTPTPTKIAIVDDVLTAGTHYRAMHIKLSERFPGVPLVGIFIARRVFPDDELDFEAL